MRQIQTSLWLVPIPIPSPPSPPHRILSSPWPSPLQVQNSSPCVSSRCSTVRLSCSPTTHLVLIPPPYRLDPTIGIYVVLFAACVKVLFSKRRRRAGGNYRLITVSALLFVLITWVRPPCIRFAITPPCSDLSSHSMKSSTLFVSSSPTRALRQRTPIFTSPT